MLDLSSKRVRGKVYSSALTCTFLTSITLLAQAAPVPTNSASEFVQITENIEILQWGAGLDRADSPRSKSFEIRAVVGRNKWVIDNPTFDQTRYSFDGMKILERARVLSALDAGDTNKSDRGWTRSSESPDGNPSQTVRVSDRLDVASRIAWLAFCSAPTLNSPEHKLYPPSEFWKEYVDPSTFVEKISRFEDDLGVPKSLLILSGDQQPIVDYRVSGTTNVAGWLFPQSFYLLEYNPTGTKGWGLQVLAQGKVSSVRTVADPFLSHTPTGASTSGTPAPGANTK